MTIFNTSNNCVETWNGTEWISTCAEPAGTISSLACGSVTGITVTQGTFANIAGLSLPYSGKAGANISLTDGQSLGTVSGLSVQVDGAQTVSATNGSITIKVTGTTTSSGTISIPITLGGANCSISVTANTPGGTISSLACSSVTGITVTQGTLVNVSGLSLPYSGKAGANISLTDGQSFGSESGLSVQVDGDQTLSATNGSIAIKVTGKATSSGTISIPIGLGTASCSISVTVIDPSSIDKGVGSFTGKTCFDVVETNDGGACGTFTARTPYKSDFTQLDTNTQTYTFTTSGTVSKIRFYAVDPNDIIESITPNGLWETATNLSGMYMLTVKYKTNLNARASGKDREHALTAILYAVYNDGSTGSGTDKQLSLHISVRDCACCGAYIASGEWREFMCYNLEADETIDPFTPHSELVGRHYQWGRNWYGPGFTGSYAPEDAWKDDTKTSSDPCPDGYRLPTRTEWNGVISNNTITNKGTWASGYNSGIQIGNELFLPSGGWYDYSDLKDFGVGGYYWSSTPASTYAYRLGLFRVTRECFLSIASEPTQFDVYRIINSLTWLNIISTDIL